MILCNHTQFGQLKGNESLKIRFGTFQLIILLRWSCQIITIFGHFDNVFSTGREVHSY